MTKNALELNGFKTIGLDDIGVIKEYLAKYQYDTCDYNALNLYAWSHFFNVRWNFYKDRILFYNFSTGMMLYPLGENFTARELAEISDLAVHEGFKGDFISVPEKYVEANKNLSDHFTIFYDRDNSDYIYLTEKLAELSGKKLQKKKNLVRQYYRMCTEPRTEIFGKKHISLCLELSKKWCMDHNDSCDDEKKLELDVMERAMMNYDELGMEGILLFDGDRLTAFAFFSEQTKDSATVHFEKFDYSYKGSAQAVNRETAIYLKSRCKFINREQDIGNEGLLKSKMSYAPERLAVTYRLYKK